METNLQDHMCLKCAVVTTEKHGLVVQGGGMENKSYTITTRYAASGIVTKFNFYTRIMEYEATLQGFVEIGEGECFDYENPNSKTRRGRKMTEKSNCLMAQENTNFMKNDGDREITLHGKKVRVLGIRMLTPTECARLQTIPTWYKWECSDSQAYRMLGNGWTVEVIKHFFSFLPFARETP